MIQLKVSLVFNNTDWQSIPDKVNAIKTFYAPDFDLAISVFHTQFTGIPFQVVSAIGGIENTAYQSTTVHPDWYSKNITPLSPDADIILLYLNANDDNPPRTSVGIMQGKFNNVVQTCIFGINETDHAYIYDPKTGLEMDQGNCFVTFANHEIAHALYLIQNIPDNTHTYFYSGQPTKVLDDLKNGTLTNLQQMLAYIKQLVLLLTVQTNQLKVVATTPTVYLWDTPLNARHSVRVLCDELGLPTDRTVNVDGKMYMPKDIICACIQQESRFDPKVIGEPNSNGTTDWGICQFNDGTYLVNGVQEPIWIGPGADFPDTQFVLDNPEKCVRVMIREYKAGHISKWSSYKFGAFKQWL